MRANYKERKWRTTMKMRWHWRVGKKKIREHEGSTAHTNSLPFHHQSGRIKREKERVDNPVFHHHFSIFSLRLSSVFPACAPESVCRLRPPTTINYWQDSSVFFLLVVLFVWFLRCVSVVIINGGIRWLLSVRDSFLHTHTHSCVYSSSSFRVEWVGR